MVLSTYLNNHKLYLLDMLYAILTWGMARIELGANTYLQFFGPNERGYLQAWSDEMPCLASDGFVLSWSNRVLLMLLDYPPTLPFVFGLALTGLFFCRLARGECWSQRNARTLVHIGLLSFLVLLLQLFINTPQGLVLSLDLPDGECALSASIGLTPKAAYEPLKAIFFCSFGLVMSEARKLDEEVRAFIWRPHDHHPTRRHLGEEQGPLQGAGGSHWYHRTEPVPVEER